MSDWWLNEYRCRFARDEIDLDEFEDLVADELRNPKPDPGGVRDEIAVSSFVFLLSTLLSTMVLVGFVVYYAQS